MTKRHSRGKEQHRWTRRDALKGSVLAVATPAVAGSAAAAQADDPGENGTVWWSELVTQDVAAAQKFYTKVIGWNPKIVALEDSSRQPRDNEPSYTLFISNDKEVAGAMKPEPDSVMANRSQWLTYFQVEDVDKSVAAALHSGGKIVHPAYDVPGGRLAVIEDPSGALVGLATPKPEAKK